MIYATVSWILVIVGALGVAFLFTIYLKMRTFSNNIMAVGSSNFHDAANSLMETPDELSPTLIDMLRSMNQIAVSKHAPAGILHAISYKTDHTLPTAVHRPDLAAEIGSMRPELQKLFLKAVIGWLNYVSHQNVITSLRISIAVMRLKSQGMDSLRAEETVGFRFLEGMRERVC